MSYAELFRQRAAEGGYKPESAHGFESSLWEKEIWITVSKAEGWSNWREKMHEYLELRVSGLSLEKALERLLLIRGTKERLVMEFFNKVERELSSLKDAVGEGRFKHEMQNLREKLWTDLLLLIP